MFECKKTLVSINTLFKPTVNLTTKSDQNHSFCIGIRAISISNTILILLELLTIHISFYIGIK